MGRFPLFIKTLADRTIGNATPGNLAMYLSAQHSCKSNCPHVKTDDVFGKD